MTSLLGEGGKSDGGVEPKRDRQCYSDQHSKEGEDVRVSLDDNASRAVRVSRDVRVVWVW